MFWLQNMTSQVSSQRLLYFFEGLAAVMPKKQFIPNIFASYSDYRQKITGQVMRHYFFVAKVFKAEVVKKSSSSSFFYAKQASWKIKQKTLSNWNSAWLYISCYTRRRKKRVNWWSQEEKVKVAITTTRNVYESSFFV